MCSVRYGEPEIGVSDSAAEDDGAAQEREKRGFAGGGERRLLRGCLRCGRLADGGPPLHPPKGRVSLLWWAVNGLGSPGPGPVIAFFFATKNNIPIWCFLFFIF